MPPPARPKALLLLLDGCRPDALLAAQAPNLRRLICGGLESNWHSCYSLHCVADPSPLSAPSWATILTGSGASVHGVTTNDLDLIIPTENDQLRVLPSECLCSAARKSSCAVARISRPVGTSGAFREGQKRARIEAASDPSGEAPSSGRARLFPPTIFHRVAQAGKKSVLVSAGTWDGVPRLCGASPLQGVNEETLLISCADVLSSRLHVHFYAREGLAGQVEAAREAVNKAQSLLSSGGDDLPDLIAVYIQAVDAAGHACGFGLDVQEYLQTIANVDSMLGGLLEMIEKRPSDEDWLVIITTDHGGSSVRDLPEALYKEFAQDCACIHKGISQSSGLKGIHGLQEIPQQMQRFLVLASPGASVQRGELTPPPEAVDVVPTLLAHLGVLPDVGADKLVQGQVRGVRQASRRRCEIQKEAV